MDIAALSTFVAVAQGASFSDAAQQLHLTQPAISKRIAALESELNTRLFDRIGRRVTLTEAGEALLPRAVRILEEVENSRRALSNLAGTVAGKLTVATSHHIGLHRLPPILRRFTICYPLVDLNLRFQGSEAICQEVEHGTLEMGIVTLPPQPRENLTLQPIWRDPLRIVCGQDHSLARQQHFELENLADYPAILTGKGTFTRDHLEQALGGARHKLQVKFSTNFLETIKMMVSVGLGWSCIPQIMLDDDLVALDHGEIQLERHLGVVVHRRRTLSNAAATLLGLLNKQRESQQLQHRAVAC